MCVCEEREKARERVCVYVCARASVSAFMHACVCSHAQYQRHNHQKISGFHIIASALLSASTNHSITSATVS